MLKTLIAGAHQGHRTMSFPQGEPPELPAQFRGLPQIDASKCADGCGGCADACPTEAISINGTLHLDLGRCIFCADCTAACPEGVYTHDYRLATRTRESLVLDGKGLELAHALDARLRKLLGR